MHHAKRLSLVAVALIGAGIFGCSKESDDKKKEETKEQPATTPEGAGLGKPAAAQLAMSGFLGAAKQAPNQPKATGGGFSGLFGGGLGGGGGLGAAMGGMLGGGGLGGGGTAAPPIAQPQEDKPVAVDVGEGEQPPPERAGGNPFPPNMKLGPPGKPGGDCVAVADRLMVLVTAIIDQQLKEQMASMDEASREMMKAQMAQYMNNDMIKNEMVKACTSQNWSQQLRDCVLVAATMEDMMKCEQYAPKGAGGGGGGGNDPDDYTDDVAAPEATAPAWTGGNSCEDVGKRMQQLYTLSMGDQSQWPEDSKKQVAEQLASANAQLVKACKDANFSDAVRSCLVKASNLESTQACWELMAGSP